MQVDYPKEWDDLPRHERRKKIRKLQREQRQHSELIKKILTIGTVVVVVVALAGVYYQLTRKSPEEIAFEEEVESVSTDILEDRVEEFPIEGRDHVQANASVSYQTNPPTSGDHLAQAENWGVNSSEIDDKAAVHGMEHGGIWISYRGVDEVAIEKLEEIGRNNPGSVIISPRAANDDPIVVSSWGKMMRLTEVDAVLIQKYIETYKNQSPEQLAI